MANNTYITKKYIIKTDPDIDEKIQDYFFNRVPIILNNDRNWKGYKFEYVGTPSNGHKVSLTPSKDSYDIIITLLHRKTKHKLLVQSQSNLVDQPNKDGFGNIIDLEKMEFSYTFYTSPVVIVIDETNWSEAYKKLNIEQEYYEQYVIFHEVGHALGYNHKPIPDDENKPYPIMYQATLGLPELKRFIPYPNESDY